MAQPEADSLANGGGLASIVLLIPIFNDRVSVSRAFGEFDMLLAGRNARVDALLAWRVGKSVLGVWSRPRA